MFISALRACILLHDMKFVIVYISSRFLCLFSRFSQLEKISGVIPLDICNVVLCGDLSYGGMLVFIWSQYGFSPYSAVHSSLLY